MSDGLFDFYVIFDKADAFPHRSKAWRKQRWPFQPQIGETIRLFYEDKAQDDYTDFRIDMVYHLEAHDPRNPDKNKSKKFLRLVLCKKIVEITK